MTDLAVLNGLVLLGDVLQKLMVAYTDCSLLNQIEGINLPVRLYGKGEMITIADNASTFVKGAGAFIDEGLASLPAIASLRFGNLTVEVLGIQGSLAMLYHEFNVDQDVPSGDDTHTTEVMHQNDDDEFNNYLDEADGTVNGDDTDEDDKNKDADDGTDYDF